MICPFPFIYSIWHHQAFCLRIMHGYNFCHWTRTLSKYVEFIKNCMINDTQNSSLNQTRLTKLNLISTNQEYFCIRMDASPDSKLTFFQMKSVSRLESASPKNNQFSQCIRRACMYMYWCTYTIYVMWSICGHFTQTKSICGYLSQKKIYVDFFLNDPTTSLFLLLLLMEIYHIAEEGLCSLCK